LAAVQALDLLLERGTCDAQLVGRRHVLHLRRAPAPAEAEVAERVHFAHNADGAVHVVVQDPSVGAQREELAKRVCLTRHFAD